MDEQHSDIVIIGAGMAGLACAAALAEAGAKVRVIDKGRGPGGRMATRRAEIAGCSIGFDHGAQYFTARDPAFRTAVGEWAGRGVAAPWPAAGEDAWVGVPGMNACVKAMAAPLGVLWNTRAEAIMRAGSGWRVLAGGAAFTARQVLIAVPAEQAAVLLAGIAPDLAARAGAVVSAPCWAVMAAFAAPLPLAEDTYRGTSGPVAWAARNSAKPGRGGGEAWVIHASPARSREWLDLPSDDVARRLLADFSAATGLNEVPEVLHLAAHRWLYAQPQAAVDAGRGEPASYDAALGIGIAGDYCHSPRVEGAWLSGRALAALVTGSARAAA